MIKLIEIYRENRKCKRFQKNIEVGINNFQLIVTRYEIGEIIFSEKALKTRLGKLQAEKFSTIKKVTLAKNQKKLYIVTEAEKKECIELECILTVEDVLEIICAPKEKYNDIPAILNTLENAYSTISIVGEDSYANALYKYFEQNKNIVVRKISKSKIRCVEGKYIIEENLKKDELIIWGDLYADKEVYDGLGTQALAFFIKDFYKTGLKIMNYLTDIDENIVPALIENNVTIMKIYVPNEAQLDRKKQVYFKSFFWKMLRHINDDLFGAIRHKKRKTQYLAQELSHLSNDNSKGYSVMHGHGKYINFDNGFRRTIGNTSTCEKNIYVFGPCFIRGLGSEDSKTIPSLLKAKVGNKYNVHNYGSEFHTCNFIMRNVEYSEGDIVLFFTPEVYPGKLKNDKVLQLDLTHTFNSIEKIENHVFDMLGHFDMVVQEKIADDVYNALEECGVLQLPTFGKKMLFFGAAKKRILEYQYGEDINFINWLDELKKIYVAEDVTRGACVMNCNPFTLGHRYLIEQAANQVEELFVFVVEENKSYFSFEERIQLVKAGVADLENVHVLPSSKYMASCMTLPGYFERDRMTDILLDASMDLTVFLQIANALGISMRFAGEEPLDRYTSQYNDNMKKMLPRYGVEFVVVPRKEENGKVISASRVRKALEEKDYSKLQELVPQTTYNFLMKKYNG